LIWRYGDQSNGAGKWVVLLQVATCVDIDEGLVKLCLMEIRMFRMLTGFNY
jgi:hypothetical protein